MKNAALPENEADRLKSLLDHQLLDSVPEDVYDDITRLASEIVGTPVAMLNLIDKDRQWHKSSHGLELREMPREYSFCSHTILNPNEVFVVPDARYDERFHDNPYVTGDPHIVFYAGVPIGDSDGHALGALCVIDSRPRELPDHKVESLKALGKLVNAHFALRRSNLELRKVLEGSKPVQANLNTIIESVVFLEKSNLNAEQNRHLALIREQVKAITENFNKGAGVSQ